MTRLPGPVEAFTEVQRLVSEQRIQFTATSRADLGAKYGTAASGLRRAQQMLQMLQADDYDHSVHLPNPPADADVYGFECDGEQWYVKLYIDVEFEPPHEAFLAIVSFHTERLKKVAPLLKRRKMRSP